MGYLIGLVIVLLGYYLSKIIIYEGSAQRKLRIKRLSFNYLTKGSLILLMILQIIVLGIGYSQRAGIGRIETLFFFFVLFLCTIIDLRYMRVYSVVIQIYIVGILILQGIQYFVYHQSALSVINIGVIALAYLVHRFFPQWLGGGDSELLIIPAFYFTTSQFLIAILGMALFGSVIGLILIALNKQHFKARIPLAPFLWLGCVVSFLYSEPLIKGYLAIWGL